ncbi:MAG: HEAT repeat domain-containing protein [Bacteroides sp.]|nr:HEAT repeat domain-containing protein [Prevotella sp.]MCM1407956.1 HEAT repeat domain-containing protein [Treponema brennaborense]MCM1469698.1 HEAT repeat domain-containing protein [Bacteroides sp.]
MKTTAFFILLFLLLHTIQADDVFEDEMKNRHETLQYGLESDVVSLIDTLIKENDDSYTDELLLLFSKTKNTAVREKLIQYFSEIKHAGLKDYALAVLSDPYNEKKSTVDCVFRYVMNTELSEASAPIIELLKSDNEEYYDSAIRALGKIGGADEALFLADMLKTNDDLSVSRKQALMRSLGELQAVETWDTLADIAQDSDENMYVRMYAAEAIGSMKKQESISILNTLFEESDANLRAYVIKGLSNYSSAEAEDTILEALKDNHYKVRIEAAAAIQKQRIGKAMPYLIYRAKNDPETAVKYACYDTIGELADSDGVAFLISVVKDKKKNDAARSKAAEIIIAHNIEDAVPAVIELAQESLKDDKLKNLRYALGKEFSKKANPLFENICAEYLAHKDSLTKGTGLDIYAKNKYSSLKSLVETIAANTKDAHTSRKAKLILGSSTQDDASVVNE